MNYDVHWILYILLCFLCIGSCKSDNDDGLNMSASPTYQKLAEVHITNAQQSLNYSIASRRHDIKDSRRPFRETEAQTGNDDSEQERNDLVKEIELFQLLMTTAPAEGERMRDNTQLTFPPRDHRMILAKESCSNQNVSQNVSYGNVAVQILPRQRLCKSFVIMILKVPKGLSIFEFSEESRTEIYAIRILYYDTNNNSSYTTDDDLKLQYKISALPKVKLVSHSVSMPTERKDWSDDTILKNMVLYRLDCFQGQNLYIVFQLEPSVKLRVVVTVNMKPTVDIIRTGEIVTNQSFRLVPFENIVENQWVYVGIIPHEDMPNEQEKTRDKRDTKSLMAPFNVTFTSRHGSNFNDRKKEWVQICKHDERFIAGWLALICKQKADLMPFYSVTFDEVYSRLEMEQTMHIDIPMTASYIIFYFVAGSLFCYCLALCYGIIRTTNQTGHENLLVLADNLKNDRYGYMLTVKTGSGSDAGTTSNIMVQLSGTLGNSKSHVLNYPDPEGRLLVADSTQSFILTTPKYLGDMKKVKLWFDSVGYRPTWCLRKFNIIDLQTKDKWTYNVHRWLDVRSESYKIILTKASYIDKSLNKKITSHIHFYFDPQNLWNIFDRSADVKFPYITRITIILSTILNTFAWTLLIYGTPTFTLRDEFYYGNIQNPLFIISTSFVSSFLSFCSNNTIGFVMRYATMKYDKKNVFHKENIFPYKVRAWAWTFLFISIYVSLIYLVVCGYWISNIKAQMWMISSSSAIVISIIIYESIFISLWNMIFVILRRNDKLNVQKKYNFDLIFKCIEEQRTYLYNKFGEYLLRPYLRHLYVPLDYSRLEAKRLMEVKKVKIARLFKDMLLFVTFVLFLYSFAFSSMNKFITNSNKKVSDLTKRGNKGGIHLDDVHNYEQIYEYLEDTFIPTIHANIWYATKAIDDATEGLMADFKSEMLGVALIRQFRRRPDCEIPRFLQFLTSNCYREGYISTEHNHSRRQHDDSGPAWEFQTENESDLQSVEGTLMRYPMGGFTWALGRTMKESKRLVQVMRTTKWIDYETKAIIIHYWIYNAHYNMFNMVTIMFECTVTEYVFAHYEVLTKQLIFVRDRRYNITIIFLVALCIMIVIRTVMFVQELFADRKAFFKAIWNYVDAILIIMTIATIAMTLIVGSKANELVDKINERSSSEFINFMGIVQLVEVTKTLTASLVCLATIRLWKSLRFGVIFRIMEDTIYLGAIPLLLAFFYVFYIIFAFCLVWYTIFAKHTDRNTIFDGFMYMVLKSLGMKELGIEVGKSDVGYGAALAVITLFMVLIFVFYTIITIIVILHYEESQAKFRVIRARYTVWEHMKSLYTYYKALLFQRSKGLRLRGGGPVEVDVETVYPKPDARYAKSIFLKQNDLDRMTVIARLSLRRQQKTEEGLTKEDFRLMCDAVVKHAYSEERQNSQVVFFSCKGKDNKVKVICDLQLIRIENIVRKLLCHSRPDIEDDEYEFEAVATIPTTEQRDTSSIAQLSRSTSTSERLDKINTRLELLNRCIKNINVVRMQKH